MKVSYRREIKRNYLIIDPETDRAEGYEIRMLQDNPMEGLLHFQVRQKEDGIQFYYDITSRQPLIRMLEGQSWRAEQLRKLMIGIFGVLERMDNYLLKENQLWLTPEYIYLEPDTFQIWLCYVPGMERDFAEDMSKLLEKILERVDHQDKESVVLAYHIYQESKKENYGIADIMRLIQNRDMYEADNGLYRDRNQGDREQAEEDSIEKEYTEREYTEREYTESGYLPKSHTKRERKVYRELKEAGAEYEKRQAGSHKNQPERERSEEQRESVGILARIWNWLTGKSKEEAEAEQMVQIPWETMFREETEKEENNARSFAHSEHNRRISHKQDREERAEGYKKNQEGYKEDHQQDYKEDYKDDYPGTVLLADFSDSRKERKLRALESGMEDIALPYYPFIIGKHVHLADYQLDQEGVSRLHLRIDREGEDYYIQDLNSTNGTRWRGRLLENNERVRIDPGDEIEIAAYRYRLE